MTINRIYEHQNLLSL